jgi:SAM-dependent methyltransferase
MPAFFRADRLLAPMLPLRLRVWYAKQRDYGAPIGDIDPATVPPEMSVNFHCNLCGAPNSAPLARLTREASSCRGCLSNVRLRAMARFVIHEVLGGDVALSAAPVRRDIAGLGLSDARAFARALARKFAYENSWYHRIPRLDITNVPPARFGSYDFVIASDVFEHVAPPVSRAFENARKLLKPGGKLVFTVPFSLEPETAEHFPDLHDWTMAVHDGAWQLTNTTVAGERQTFDDLTFHGGPGTTLEMRLFSRAGLEREFTRAGFARMRVAAEPHLPFGIHWPHPFSVPMVAYAS